jgi:hypothetical protein
MRIAILLAAATVTISSLPFRALQENSAAQQSAMATAGEAAVDQSANVHAQTSAEGVVSNRSASAEVHLQPVNGELVGNLDAETARSGDSIAVTTKENVRTADGMIIPKGSRLIGHVTEVEAHGSGHADSILSIAFDRAELKSGQSLAIHSVIQSVAPPTSEIAAASIDSDDSVGAPMGRAVGSGGPVAGASRAGGSGLVANTVFSPASTTGGAASNLGSTADRTVRTTGNLAGNTAASVDSGVHGTAGAVNSLSAHATAVPGVRLEGSAFGSTSGTFSSSKKNVHLDSGTQMVLAISTAAAN